MAKNLEKIKGKIAFLCGDIHASKKIIILSKNMLLLNKFMRFFGRGFLEPKDGRIEPCASLLPLEKTLSYRITVAWRCCHSCGVDSRQIILKSEEEGFDYDYLVDNFTYSP